MDCQGFGHLAVQATTVIMKQTNTRFDKQQMAPPKADPWTLQTNKKMLSDSYFPAGGLLDRRQYRTSLESSMFCLEVQSNKKVEPFSISFLCKITVIIKKMPWELIQNCC